MKVLLAGGAGYIGTMLAPRLAQRGYEVEVVDLCWFGNQLPAGTRVQRRDVLGLRTEDLAGVDVVVFIAGLSNDPMAEFSPALNYVQNAAAPANLAYHAKRAGVSRFVFGSTCSVYGFTNDELWDESAPTTAIYPYGISKLQGEAGVRHLADDEFSVIILRKGTVSGYSPRMRLDLVVNTMFTSALQRGRITVNNPSIWRPILAIEDAVTAYVRAVEAAPGLSGTFNIASENVTLGGIADEVAATLLHHLDVMPELEILHRHDVRNYKVAVDRARLNLGFAASGTVRSIVEDLIANRDRFSDFDNPAYSNIATFKSLQGQDLGLQGMVGAVPPPALATPGRV